MVGSLQPSQYLHHEVSVPLKGSRFPVEQLLALVLYPWLYFTVLWMLNPSGTIVRFGVPVHCFSMTSRTMS